MNKPLLVVFLFLLSSASAEPQAEQEFSAVSGSLSAALADAAHESTTSGPFCWRRKPEKLADELGVPARVCVERFDLLTTKTETLITVAGSPIQGTFPMSRVPLLDSYHGWHQVWQTEILTAAKGPIDGYERVAAHLKILVALKKKGRPAEAPELDGDLDVEYKLPEGDVSRWTYLVTFEPENIAPPR
ncbi:MAG: hypothetical protein ACHQ2Z_13860 [Elusimicrobiota bacterium]